MDINSDTYFVSVVGGADGPASVFPAGKADSGFGMGIIVFVLAVLIFAAVLVLWKPKVKTEYYFIRLSVGNLLIHLMDGLITFVNTPDLDREGNVLVARFGFGWGALFLANFFGFLLILLITWYFCRYEHVRIPAESTFDYYMKLFYGEGYKPSWFWFKFSKNRRCKYAMISYGIYWGLTACAPVFVIGWILDMLDIEPAWWHDYWIAAGLGIVVAYGCIYKWVHDGYKISHSEKVFS